MENILKFWCQKSRQNGGRIFDSYIQSFDLMTSYYEQNTYIVILQALLDKWNYKNSWESRKYILITTKNLDLLSLVVLFFTFIKRVLWEIDWNNKWTWQVGSLQTSRVGAKVVAGDWTDCQPCPGRPATWCTARRQWWSLCFCPGPGCPAFSPGREPSG